jgi:hypothetical protein
MELENIKLQTTWNDAAERINRNNLKIATELTKLGASTYKNKGYFSSSNALIRAYPYASDGCIAYVGTSYPYTIYVWSKAANTWVNSGQTGGDVNVELGDYYTKEETKDAIEDFHVFLTQEAYDALETKEEKLYFCYEE